MHKRSLFLLGLLTLGNVQAQQLPEEIIEYIDGVKVVAFLDKANIDANIGWQPLSGPPPVTIEQLARKLQDYVATRPSLAGATLEAVELKHTPHHKNSWHYLAIMQTREGGQPGKHYFVVLMNGDVIPAIMEPASVR